ncbi:hypothetical protein C8F04DRAFT_1074664 [Mycena alexandri]|uniref:Uncharacterized protein n=1 Tax=Mycena alexandri TaxID=1745969 RepID=A0AAD6TF17_9AGAR|nr:hypothetical protein C8F04DRAFT_1074664 [Mycena alexandri]
MALVLSDPDIAMDIPPGMPTTGPYLELRLKMWAGFELLIPSFATLGIPPSARRATRWCLMRSCIWWPFRDTRCSKRRWEKHSMHCVLENVKVGHVTPSPREVQEPGNEGRWPSNTAAFFPTGTGDAIVSFTQLYRLTKAPSILGFIRVALQHCPSLAAPAVNSPAFWEALLQELGRAAHHLHEDSMLTGVDSAYSTEDGPPPLVSIRAIVTLFQALILTFTESLRQNIQSSSLMPYARPIYDILLKIFLEMKKWPLRPALDDFSLCVMGVAMTIITTLPKTHPQRPRTLHPILMAEAERKKGGDFSNVYSVIARLSESVAQCCNAACITTSESSSQKLRYCAQCGAWRYHKLVLKKDVIPYASRQKKKSGNASHAEFMQAFEKESLKQGITRERMKEISAELMPFLPLPKCRNDAHEKANHK